MARFTLRRGERASFVLNYRASHQPAPPALDASAALLATEQVWAEWSAPSAAAGPQAIG